MAKPEERARVLRMVEEGTITAEEGARLLAAMGQGSPASARASAHSGRRGGRRAPGPSGGAGMLRLRVTDAASGRRKVDVQMPTGVVEFLLGAGSRLGLLDVDLGGLDLDEVRAALGRGTTGRVLDWFDDESGQRVEIYVE